MVADVLVILEAAFAAAVQFFSQIVASLGGEDFIIFAVSIVLTVSLLFLPLRGSSLSRGGFVSDFKKGKTSGSSKNPNAKLRNNNRKKD